MAVCVLKLSADRPIVFSDDAALNREAPGFEAAWAKYSETFDLTLLPKRDGLEFTVFHVGSLTVEQATHLDNQMGLGERITESIAYGVHAITGLEVEGEDHQATSLVVNDSVRVDSPRGRRLPPDVLSMFVDPKLRLELWAAVNAASRLSKRVAKSD